MSKTRSSLKKTKKNNSDSLSAQSKQKNVKKLSLSIKKLLPIELSIKQQKVVAATSPRKTRGIYKKEDDQECEACNTCEPIQLLRSCPKCISLFHLTCMGLEPEAIFYLSKNIKKWQCPRCICCAKCNLYIYDAENLQCQHCARAFHKLCKPKKTDSLTYLNTKWTCDRCNENVASVKNKNKNNFLNFLKKLPSKSMSESPKKNLHNNVKSNQLKVCDNVKSLIGSSLSRFSQKNNLINTDDFLQNQMDDFIAEHFTPQNQHLTSDELKKRNRKKIMSKFELLDDSKSEITTNTNELSLQKNNIVNQWIFFGPFIRIKPTYESLYSKNGSSFSNVYICEFCLRALFDVCEFKNHLTYCPWKHPPGNEIYRDSELSLWEVEGKLEPIYCRNLCLLAKFFLSSKTLYHEVETFSFYILTEIKERGCVLAGYFSKEKHPSKNNNLSCLLTLPAHQSKGYGKMLIDLSYHFSRREHKIGSPEHPLSDMGLITYRSYWKSAIVCALRKRRNNHIVSIKELSIETGIHSCDIISTFLALGMITFRNDYFYIDTNIAFNASLKSFRRRTIDSNLLIWEPPFDTDSNCKMNSYAAD